jgi:serine/threonine-protein kinase HipA
MTHELMVWFNEWRVGRLFLQQGRIAFQYDAAWLAASIAFPLSQSLPLQEAVFDDRLSRPFFAGLLPEGEKRRLVAQALQVSRQNDFALLDGIGGECAGAVMFLEQDQLPPSRVGEQSVRWLDDDALVALLNELPKRPMLAGQEGLRLSLAGAQDKLPVVLSHGRLGVPLHNTPSTHILKPMIQDIEGSVFNEGFCLALAEALKLKVARSQIMIVQYQSFLLVERYDRQMLPDGSLLRLHQEDFCQALGVVPEYKYQNEGGPSLKQCFELIRQATRPNAPQVLMMLDYVIFNALIGNHDAHGKNFSLLYHAKGAVLAPLYDALATAVYPSLTVRMAMKLGSKYEFDQVYERHWLRFAEEAGLSPSLVKKRVREIANKLPGLAMKVKSDFEEKGLAHEILAMIVALIQARCGMTIVRLAVT